MGDSRADRPRDRYEVTHVCSELAGAPDGTRASIAGRVMALRRFGRLVFADLRDRSGRLQVSLERGAVDDEVFADWRQSVSSGDFVGIDGRMWTTQKGERTLAVDDFTLLQKSRRPMPDKWHGVTDKEVAFRKRFLDLLYSPDSRERFLVRSRAVRVMREYLDARGFVEVETPVLQDAASGASARPFATHHHALDRDFYLRISPETYLKRLVAGGLDRVYELGRNFRNEGMDASHLQEFTMLEWYVAYWSYRDNMRFVRELIQHVLRECVGSTRVRHGDVELDFAGEWPEVDYREAVRDATGIDLGKEPKRPDVVAGLIPDLPKGTSYAGAVDALYKRFVRPNLVQPTFLLHHPAELVPLARRSDDDPGVLDMFQVVAKGWEVVKAYSELVDPVEQRARLEEQVALREAGDEETMMMEEDFLEAMEFGMPPMSGLGLGVDRFVALVTGADSLREIVLFPQMGRTP